MTGVMSEQEAELFVRRVLAEDITKHREATLSIAKLTLAGLTLLSAIGVYMFGQSLSEAQASARAEMIRQLKAEGMLEWVAEEIRREIPSTVQSAASDYLSSQAQADLDRAATEVIERIRKTDEAEIIARNLLNIEVGNITITSGTIPKGSGKRVHTTAVQFPTGTFKEPPRIALGLHYIDASGTVRIAAEARDITAEGFTAEIYTWASSTLHRAEVSFVAVGPRGDL